MLSVVAAAAYLSLKPRPGHWQKLAEFTDLSGARYVVQQEHVSWSQGWRVSFSFFSGDGRLYGSLLQMESFLPWKNVRLATDEDSVSIWRGNQLVGTHYRSDKIFTNYLHQTFDRYVVGFNDVQGQVVTNRLQ